MQELAVAENLKLKDNEIQSLLNNIIAVLKLYSTNEFNELMLTAINKKQNTFYSEKYILECVCDACNITYNTLINSKGIHSVAIPRKIAYCLLHYTLGLSVRYIAIDIFHYKTHSKVAADIKSYERLDSNIKTDREFKEAIEKLKTKILAKLNNN